MGFRGLWLLALGAGVALHLAAARPAHAMCAPATEGGRWQNLNPDAGGIVSIEIEMNCQPLKVNGEAWPPGYAWNVRVFEKCGTDECEWGEIGAITRISRHITAVYDRGQAEKRVYLRMDPLTPYLLSAYVYEEFRNFGHANFGRHYWFRNLDPQPCTVPITDHDWESLLWEWFDCEPQGQT
jgi:hypothetical protein